ncbi:hypothetical protein FOZ63_008562, partial [Perkinsus olseni]
TYKAVEQNGTICPELPRLLSFEMVVTSGGRGQLASFNAELQLEKASQLDRDLIVCQTELGLVVGLGANRTGGYTLADGLAMKEGARKRHGGFMSREASPKVVRTGKRTFDEHVGADSPTSSFD